jgi:hypothetical protein
MNQKYQKGCVILISNVTTKMLYFSPIASAVNTTKSESPLLCRVQSEKKGQNEL